MEDQRIPRIWYVGHVIFWVITGLAVYVLYKEKAPKAARHHLITSIWMPVVIYVIFSVALFALGLDPFDPLGEYDFDNP